MEKRVKFQESNLNTGIKKITPKNGRTQNRSYGHGGEGLICEKTANSNVKRSAPRDLKDPMAISIPTTLAEAPFLQHSRLTPGQKRYLDSIAGVYSDEQVWKLLQQHYMNVARRCIRTELSIKVSKSLEPLPSKAQASVSETESPNIIKTSGQKHLKKEKNRLQFYNQRKRGATKNVESKRGRKGKTSGDQANLDISKGPSKSDVQKDTDDEDSLDELIKALSLEAEEDGFFL